MQGKFVISPLPFNILLNAFIDNLRHIGHHVRDIFYGFTVFSSVRGYWFARYVSTLVSNYH